MTPFRFTASTSVAALAIALPAAAQAPDRPIVEEVVVVTRLPARAAVTPGAYVVDRADIEARGAVLAADVLQTVPGLNVVRAGAFGGTTSIRQRGASADKTLVLLDGVPVNDPSHPDGSFDFRSLELADIERVEVLSGPQGSLWGSDAIGGVIAFTSRELEGARAEAETGAFGTVRGSAAIGRRSQRYAFGLSASGFRTDGISKADRLYGNTERDGFRTATLAAYGRADASERVRLEGRIRYNAARAEVDGFGCVANCGDADFSNHLYALTDTEDLSKSRTWSGFGRVGVADLLGFHHSLSLNVMETRRTDFSPYAADRRVYRWTAERGRAEDPLGLLAGAERIETSAELGSGEAAAIGLTSAFVVARARPVAPLSLTASLRHDDPDSGRGQTTARASAVWTLGAGFGVAASYGQGFKVPTVSHIVCDFCWPPGPSVGLRPERAQGYDLGLTWRSADGIWDAGVTAYRIHVRDQIVYSGGRYRNIARAASRGVEARAEAALGTGFRLQGAYAYTEAEDRSTGRSLLRVPRHSGAATLAWSGGRLQGAISIRAESNQADTGLDGFSRVRRPGFVLADLRVAYGLTETVRLSARVENLANRRYQEAFGYGEPGRAAYLGLALQY